MTATPLFMRPPYSSCDMLGMSKLVIALIILALCQHFHSSWRLGAVATAVGSSSPRNHTYKPSDFVIVINTDQTRLPLALASRPLRFGIRTFIALDNETLVEQLIQRGNEHHETYAFFPNRNISGPERDKPGDTRWQAAPFMAHAHYGKGSYRWLLLGDDDTLWFMRGAARLLHAYDPSLPYALSDHLGDHNNAGFFVPSPFAAVCAPCHWPDALAAHGKQDLLRFGPPSASEEELAGWPLTERDGWAWGRLRFRSPEDADAAFAADMKAQGLDAAAVSPEDRAAWLRKRKRYWIEQLGLRPLGWRGRNRQQQEAVKGVQDGKRELRGEAGEGDEVEDAEGVGERRGAGEEVGVGEEGHDDYGDGAPRISLQNMTVLLKQAYSGGRPWGSHALVGSSGGSGGSSGSSSSRRGGSSKAKGGRGGAKGPVQWGKQPLVPPPGCPCTPALACLHRGRVCRGSTGRGQELCGRASVFKTSFRGNGSWCRHSWAHGGAGVILSHGLLASLAGGPAEQCARTTHIHSCDMNLALCLMHAGVMVTHPSSALLHGASWADPRFILFDNPMYPHVVRDPASYLEGRSECTEQAQLTALVRQDGEVHGAEEDGEDEGDGMGVGRRWDGQGEDEGARRRLAGQGMGRIGRVEEEGGEGRWGEGGGERGGDRGARELRQGGEGGGEPARGKAGMGTGPVVGPGMVARRHTICDWLVRHAVSAHMHARSFPSVEAAAAAVGEVARRHHRAAATLAELAREALSHGQGAGHEGMHARAVREAQQGRGEGAGRTGA